MIFFLTFFLVVLAIYMNHRIKTNRYNKHIKTIGHLVQINNDKMSLYVTGTGDKTIVFLSGGLTASPILDFKPLYSKLASKYQIVVIEKFGYGFSSDSENSRCIENMLEESRKLLKKENIQGPYVLVPHSMSGIEALYWADTYPEEVESIIGLDMATSQAYESLKINLLALKVNRLLVKLGIARILPKVTWSDAIKNGLLTLQEQKLNEELFYKNFTSKATLNEVKQIKSNAKKVANANVQSLPMLIFASNGQGTGYNQKDWQHMQKKLKETSNKSRLITLDCPHYIHSYEATKIANEINLFLESQ